MADDSRAESARRLDACLGAPDADPRRWFAEPQAVVESAAPYVDRLAALQQWRAYATRHDDPATLRAVESAVRALEQGAALGQDPPEEAPAWGYGVPREP